jgi:replication factor C subunit 2/4
MDGESNNNKFIDCLPWIEKHRPNKMVNIKLDNQIKSQIRKMIHMKEIPSLILEGPPGVGKTSTIRCIAREIYGKYYNDMVLEMNASDDRGIKIQDSIENFRKSYVQIAKEDKIPKFKMVILDEADNMTDKAKHIISGFIKNCVNDLRFAFTCNAKDNIISSIQSGCHIIKYPPLSDDIIIYRLKEICIMEKIITDDTPKKKIKIIEDGIKSIAQITNGDLRYAINILQLTYNRFGDISTESIFEIHDRSNPQKSKEIILLCCENKLGEAIKKIIIMMRKGYSGTDIALGFRLALRLEICNDIREDLKIEFLKCISYASYNISKGVDSTLQITACVADMCLSAHKLKKNKNGQ